MRSEGEILAGGDGNGADVEMEQGEQEGERQLAETKEEEIRQAVDEEEMRHDGAVRLPTAGSVAARHEVALDAVAAAAASSASGARAGSGGGTAMGAAGAMPGGIRLLDNEMLKTSARAIWHMLRPIPVCVILRPRSSSTT